ncbi:hypothetical protein AB1Y20_021946 [Prymnesium parvum]|uniref:Exostosin GT47 domain-containing protein n=1 Tax=Prymnesium parvum TaxID=97485 RepID=A0AB34JEW9_PRYPA
MRSLSGSLKGSIVGRYKSGPFPAASRVGSCVIAIPWESNPAAIASYRPPQPRATPADAPATSKHRPLLMHFAGALDVCCTGQHIRCAMGPLAAETAGESDVLMRYIIPPNRSLWKPCTRRAVQLMHEKQGKLSLEKVTAVGRARQALLRAGGGSSANDTTAMLARRGPGGRHGAKHLAMGAERQLNEELAATQKRAATVLADANSIKENWRYVATSLFEQTAYEMASSVFCLMPAGDNGIRSLMYSAIAAGCLPVILCDSLTPRSLPFSSIVPWESFWIKLSTRIAQRDPLSVLRSLRAINGSEVRRRQRIMAHHRADLVYGLRDSRVGDNFVLEAAATRCAKLESASA